MHHTSIESYCLFVIAILQIANCFFFFLIEKEVNNTVRKEKSMLMNDMDPKKKEKTEIQSQRYSISL